MTRHESAQILCKAKVRGLCFLLLLYFHPGVADVPGTCRHSMRKDHLVTIRRLIDNQLQNGCSITYTFTQQGGLSKACYVKAALPQVLELLSTHFGYAGGSDNGRYVQALKELLHNVYSQKCIPALNEELEDDPVKFSKVYSSSPREALEKAQQVLSFYVELMTMNDMPVNWNCEEEYGETYPEFTTAPTQPTERPAYRRAAPGSSEDPYRFALMLTPVCGGLLLLIALCFLRRNKKLQNLLRRFQMTENQRLTSCSTQDLEMQEQTCLPSPYRK
ncbi:macrophage colony-stimulating factor 1b isoform X2 [Megalops cyprinoides]|uniref:macrophage colony-stimulating factor 1b isoform X2 n=1 Tax=Megalops cyprinoides TaxID=118141 RepID=UPI001865357C|nr:macrophage colony-stimulating factor 1b isoform X2 [Megalops cyprinoides]